MGFSDDGGRPRIWRTIETSLTRLSRAARELGGTSPAPAAPAPDGELLALRAFKARMDQVERSAGHELPIFLDYLPSSTPRWGWGKPPHPELERLIDARRDSYRDLLTQFVALSDRFAELPITQPRDPSSPHLLNGWLSAMDALALYSFLAIHRPARYVEIGSGNSTRFARQSIRDFGLPTQITSIDPHPRVEIDAICDRVIRSPLEATDLGVFSTLEAGDILFFDDSHRSFMNSDVTVCFLEILPRLRPGVLVHLHDILLPEDYPKEWSTRYYSEQYLLACYLLGGAKNVEVLLPNHFITATADLHRVLQPLWAKLPTVEHQGCSFWLKTT